jgi:hypothetical protein
VFENRVLRRIFGPKSEEVAGDWRRLHNEEFHNMHISSNNIMVIKSSRAGHVARMGDMKNTCRILVVNLKGRGTQKI